MFKQFMWGFCRLLWEQQVQLQVHYHPSLRLHAQHEQVRKIRGKSNGACKVSDKYSVLKILCEASHTEVRIWFGQQPEKDPLTFLQFTPSLKK